MIVVFLVQQELLSVHTFVCTVGLPHKVILVCEHDIICVHICLYKCTNKVDVLSHFCCPLGVNKYNCYGYSRIVALSTSSYTNTFISCKNKPHIQLVYTHR